METHIHALMPMAGKVSKLWNLQGRYKHDDNDDVGGVNDSGSDGNGL